MVRSYPVRVSVMQGGVEVPVKLSVMKSAAEAFSRLDTGSIPPVFKAFQKLDYATGRTTSTVNAPSSTVGDLVLLFLLLEDGATAPATIPSGFALIPGLTAPLQFSPSGNGVNSYGIVYYKFVGAGEPSTYSFTHTSCASEITALAYSGVNTTTPFDVTPSQTTGVGTTMTAAQITTLTPATMIILLAACWFGWSENVVPPMFNQRDWLSDRGLMQSDLVQTSAGPTGTKTVTCSGNTGDGWALFLVALRPI